MVSLKGVLNKKHFLVSMLVVISLFLTFISQTVTASISCDSNNECTLISVSSTTSVDADHHDENHCEDPCHLGFSHFGHCAVTVQNSNFNLDSVSLNKEIAYFNLFMKDPFIKGLRRPPRSV